MSAGASVGRSPCTLTTMPARRLRVDRLERLENAVGAGGMIGARHHGAAAGLLHAGRDRLANRSRPRPGRAWRPPRAAARARSSARPAISASGLPGSRVEAMRAGIRMRTSAIALPSAVRPGRSGPRQNAIVGWPVIRVARGEENRLFVRRRNGGLAWRSLHRARPIASVVTATAADQREPEAMDSFELNKILGAVLGTCLACCR